MDISSPQTAIQKARDMRWLRSTRLLRCTALLLLGAMATAFAAPSNHAAPSSISSSYAEWIRMQLRIPVDAAVDKALEDASASKARSFDSFVSAFLSAYERTHPGESAARAFVDRDLADDALIAYLERRYTEIGGDAVPLRLRLGPPPALSTLSSSAGGTLLSDLKADRRSMIAAIALTAPTDVVASIRSTTPACPQGP